MLKESLRVQKVLRRIEIVKKKTRDCEGLEHSDRCQSLITLEFTDARKYKGHVLVAFIPLAVWGSSLSLAILTLLGRAMRIPKQDGVKNPPLTDCFPFLNT